MGHNYARIGGKITPNFLQCIMLPIECTIIFYSLSNGKLAIHRHHACTHVYQEGYTIQL